MATSILKELDKYFPTVISNLILDFSNDRNDKFDEVLKDYNNMMKKSFESAYNEFVVTARLPIFNVVLAPN